MNAHAKGGNTKQTYDLLMKDKYDVLVMGSSRAHHHYVPSIISDSLSVSCYNAGYDGNGILLAYGLYGVLTERYNPKLIIYDVEPAFDIVRYDGDCNNTRYLGIQKPYYKNPFVAEVMRSVSYIEYVKSLSSLYRYNGKLTIAMDFFSKRKIYTNGYSPFYDNPSFNVPEKIDSNLVVDPLKIEYVHKFINATKSDGIPLVFVASPKFGAKELGVVSLIKSICKEENVPFLDFYTDSMFMAHKELFRDYMHLNDKGAIAFTQRIIPYIQCYFESATDVN